MEKSHWARYIEERLDFRCIERDFGFVTYSLKQPGTCEIIDLYVIPERRKSGCTKLLYADLITEAKAAGAKSLITSIWPGYIGSETSMQTALAYGFRLYLNDGGRTILIKNIEGD